MDERKMARILPSIKLAKDTEIDMIQKICQNKQGDDASSAILLPNMHIETEKHMNVTDFKMLKLIGKGRYGPLYQVSDKVETSNACYMLKSFQKARVMQDNDLDSIHLQKEIHKLGELSPFITKLIGYFQNEVIKFKILISVKSCEQICIQISKL